jgi:hypothetical protein
VLGTEPEALCMIGKHSTAKPHTLPVLLILKLEVLVTTSSSSPSLLFDRNFYK